jgi:hypothetical protein
VKQFTFAAAASGKGGPKAFMKPRRKGSDGLPTQICGRVQQFCFRLQASPAGREVLPQPKAKVCRAAQLSALKDVIELLELKGVVFICFVFMHGSAPRVTIRISGSPEGGPGNNLDKTLR